MNQLQSSILSSLLYLLQWQLAAINFLRGYMEEMIFDNSYLLRTAYESPEAFDFLRVVYSRHLSNCSYSSFLESIGFVCVTKIVAFIHYLKDIFWPEILQSSISEELFQRWYVFISMFISYAAIHSFNVSFSDVELSIHLLLPVYFLSVYFGTSVTVKQTCFQRSYILRLFIFLKNLVVWSSYFFLISNNYFLVTNTFSDHLLFEDNNFFSTVTTSEELFLQNK